MKVSIITATYNSEKTILETIDSLGMQTYKNIEYIIIDGASTDNTLEIISDKCKLNPVILSEPDNGIYDALNKGISLATGDVVGFLHSDDLFAYSDAIKDIVHKFQETQSDAVYADLEYVSKSNLNDIIRYWKSGAFDRAKLKLGWMPPHPTFYMKKSIYQKLGKFDLRFKIAADYDSMLRYIWLNKINVGYLEKVVIKMRVGGASNGNLTKVLNKTREDIAALKKNEIFWPIALTIKNISKLPQFFIKK